MKSLRLRIAAILVGSILSVVIVASAMMIALFVYPQPERMVGMVAVQVDAIQNLYRSRNPDETSPVNRHIDNDELGAERPELSSALRQRLEGYSTDVEDVKVYDMKHSNHQIAYVQMKGHPIYIEVPPAGPPPLDFLLTLIGWVVVVIVGVAIVALVMAQRVTRPFAMLEDAIASVGSDGVLPKIAETGSGELRVMAEAFNRLSTRLKTAMESRIRLVAAAGHDLRTPITRMRIRAEFLDQEEREAWLRDIDELERIADSAIRLVREEVSNDPPEPVAVHEMLVSVIDELRNQGHDLRVKKIQRIKLPLPHLAITRALRNLLINAATHGKGADVSLNVTDTEAIIIIHDHGPGIPEDLLDQVFEPFFRAEPGRLHTIPGAGLGLAIANEIIQRAGGTLNIENDPAGGLIQKIRFPIQAKPSKT